MKKTFLSLLILSFAPLFAPLAARAAVTPKAEVVATTTATPSIIVAKEDKKPKPKPKPGPRDDGDGD